MLYIFYSPKNQKVNGFLVFCNSINFFTKYPIYIINKIIYSTGRGTVLSELEAVEGGTRMLQSIQYIGSGPPTYIYSKNAAGASGEFYHVFAAETRGYDKRRERKTGHSAVKKEAAEKTGIEQDEFKVLDNTKKENLQDVYQKEYGKRESFLWKQR